MVPGRELAIEEAVGPAQLPYALIVRAEYRLPDWG